MVGNEFECRFYSYSDRVQIVRPSHTLQIAPHIYLNGAGSCSFESYQLFARHAMLDSSADFLIQVFEVDRHIHSCGIYFLNLSSVRGPKKKNR